MDFLDAGGHGYLIKVKLKGLAQRLEAPPALGRRTLPQGTGGGSSARRTPPIGAVRVLLLRHHRTTQPLAGPPYLRRAGHLGDLDRRSQEPDGTCTTENRPFPGQRGAVPMCGTCLQHPPLDGLAERKCHAQALGAADDSNLLDPGRGQAAHRSQSTAHQTAPAAPPSQGLGRLDSAQSAALSAPRPTRPQLPTAGLQPADGLL